MALAKAAGARQGACAGWGGNAKGTDLGAFPVASCSLQTAGEAEEPRPTWQWSQQHTDQESRWQRKGHSGQAARRCRSSPEQQGQVSKAEVRYRLGHPGVAIPPFTPGGGGRARGGTPFSSGSGCPRGQVGLGHVGNPGAESSDAHRLKSSRKRGHCLLSAEPSPCGDVVPGGLGGREKGEREKRPRRDFLFLCLGGSNHTRWASVAVFGSEASNSIRLARRAPVSSTDRLAASIVVNYLILVAGGEH